MNHNFLIDDSITQKAKFTSGWLADRLPRTVKTYLTDEELEENGFVVRSDLKGLGVREDVENVTYVSFNQNKKYDDNQWLVSKSEYIGNDKKVILPWISLFEKRIDELRNIAAEETSIFDEDSAAAALMFIGRLQAVRQPGAFLVDGNIRLVWDKPDGQQVGLQFRGSDKIQFIMFEKDGDDLGSLMGVKSINSVRHMILAPRIFSIIADS